MALMKIHSTKSKTTFYSLFLLDKCLLPFSLLLFVSLFLLCMSIFHKNVHFLVHLSLLMYFLGDWNLFVLYDLLFYFFRMKAVDYTQEMAL